MPRVRLRDVLETAPPRRQRKSWSTFVLTFVLTLIVAAAILALLGLLAGKA